MLSVMEKTQEQSRSARPEMSLAWTQRAGRANRTYKTVPDVNPLETPTQHSEGRNGRDDLEGLKNIDGGEC